MENTEKPLDNKKQLLFDNEFKVLVKQLKDTINAKYEKNIAMGESNNDLICLNNYLTAYERTKNPMSFYQYFETVYNVNRMNILNCLKDDSWLCKENIFIEFGNLKKDAPRETIERAKLYRIYISNIYAIACDLRIEAELFYANVGDSFVNEEGGKDLIRSDVLLLHLMRIFYYLNGGPDKTPLLKIVNTLEEKVGTTIRTKDDVVEIKSVLPTGDAPVDAISGLFNLTAGMMEKFGYKTPPNFVPPTGQQIFGVIESIIGDPNTQNAMNGMVTSLNGCNNLNDAVRSVAANLTEPSTMQVLEKTLGQTAQMAVNVRNDNNMNTASTASTTSTTSTTPESTNNI